MALTLEEFLPKARQLNPDYTDDELIQAYQERYRKAPTQTVSPAPLMTLDEFLPKARTLNPDYSDEELTAAWQEKYGARGAKEKDQGDFIRGGVTAFKQIPQTVRGLEAGAGAIGEKIAGEGGLFTALKEHGLKGYQEHAADIAKDSKPSDSVTEAYKMAKAGDAGALVDWLQYALGYGGGQALQMLATAGMGYAGGKLALQPAARTLADKLIAKESARLAATGMAGEQLAKQAVSNVAARIGQTAALAGTAVGMEGGEIYGGLVEKAAQEGRSLTGEELARATGATLGAGALEFVGDKIGLDLILGKSVAGKLVSSRLGHAAAAGSLGVATEGGTEFTQTLIEEFGKGNDPLAPESIKQAVDAAALGGVGGGAVGTVGGIIRRPEGQVPEPVVTERQPDEMGMQPSTQPEVLPPQRPAQIEGPIQPGEVRGGKVYAPGEVLDVSPLPDVSPVLNASSLDDAIASAVGVVRGATETAKARAAEFARMTAKAKNETDALLERAPEKRPAFDVPTLPGPEAQPATLLNQPSPIVPGQAFTPRPEPIDDPRARLAEERARMVAQREQQRMAEQKNQKSSAPLGVGTPTSGESVNSPGNEGGSDAVITNPQSLRDFAEREPFKSHGFGGLDVPSQRVVMSGMFDMAKDLKVRDAIIRAIPVDMVNSLRRQQLTPEMLLKDEAVFRDSFISDAYIPIPIRVKAADAAIRAVAGTATELDREYLGSTSPTEEGGLALDTGISAGSSLGQPPAGLATKFGDRGANLGEFIENGTAVNTRKIVVGRQDGTPLGSERDSVSLSPGEVRELIHEKGFHLDTPAFKDYLEKTTGKASFSELSANELQALKNSLDGIREAGTNYNQEFQKVPQKTPQASVEEPKKVPLSRKERLAQQKQKMEGKKPDQAEPTFTFTIHPARNTPMSFDEFLERSRFYRSGRDKMVEVPGGKKFIARREATAGNFREVSRNTLQLMYDSYMAKGNSQKPEIPKPAEPSPSNAPEMESQPATASPEREPAPSTPEAAPNKKQEAEKTREVSYGARATKPKITIAESSSIEGSSDSIFGHAKFLGDLVEREPFKSQGLGGFDAPGQRAVLKAVFLVAQDLKIRKAIIGLLPINMVDNLRSQQLTPELLLDNKAMLLNSLSSNRSNDVALSIDVANSLVRVSARAATETLGISTALPPENLSAVGAGNVNSSRNASRQGMKAGTATILGDTSSASAIRGEGGSAGDTNEFRLVPHDTPNVPHQRRNAQTEIPIPREVVGSRPIIGREATLDEAPLFSKNAQTPDAEQTTLEETPAATPKEPWQMTRQEFLSSPDGFAASPAEKILGKRFIGASDLKDKAETYHKFNIIQPALREGKPVPPEVLADYPDLQQVAERREQEPEGRGYTKVGVIDYGDFPKDPEWQRMTYGPNGGIVKIVGEKGSDVFASRVAGSSAYVDRYPKAFIDALDQYYTPGHPVRVKQTHGDMDVDGLAELLTKPVPRDGFTRVRIRMPDGTEHEITTAGLLDRPNLKDPSTWESWKDNVAPEPAASKPAPSPTEIIADALRTAADKIAGKPSTESIDTVDKYQAFRKRLLDGEVTLDEYKQAFQQVYDNKESFLAQLKKLNKEQLVKQANSFHARKGDSKDLLIQQAYEGIIRGFALGRAVSYHITGNKNAHEDAISKMVDQTTADDLAKFAEKVAKERADYKKRIEGFKDPQTLEDFETRVEIKGEASLTPEQLARYDELLAQAGRAKRKQAQEQKATVQGVEAGTDLQLIESKHTKTGEKLWVVKLANRVDRAVYDRLNQAAHKLGGRYSSYNKDGAIPGFTFRSEEAAKSFMAAGKGETVSAAPVREAAKAEVQNNAVSKLRKMADNLEEKSDNSLNADRNTNTAKRARQASHAENDAYANKALAETMRNLADAIESGEATHLSGLRTKAQVEMLDSMLEQAKNDRIRKDTKGSYVDYERQKHRKAEPGDAAEATFPTFTLWKDALNSALAELKDVKGTERLRMRFSKIMAGVKEDGKREVPREDAELALEKRRPSKYPPAPYWQWEIAATDLKRLESMGITSLPELRAALREYVEYRGKRGTIDKAKQLERELIGNKGIGNDFFPTPKEMAQRMVAEAGIEPGMKVLEPSAGNGNIAEVIRDAGVKPDVVEQSSRLREILEAKGFNLVGQDFMDVKDGGYDRIVMNPPFSNGQDAEHIHHAYTLLKPGGKLVAIAGEGIFFRNDAKATAFQKWLDDVDGTSEKLPEGTFKDPSLMATTGVNARMVVIEKPVEDNAKPDSFLSFLMDERGSIPASFFGRRKRTQETGTIDPTEVRDRLAAVKTGTRPYLLGALGLEQLSQVYGNDHAEVRRYNKATQAMEADFTEMSRESDAVARAWTDLKIPVADKMAKVMEDARFLNFDPDSRKKQEADSAKKQELRTRFEQLPDEAKSVYRMARDFYTNMAEQRFQALKERIERAGGTPENTRKLVDRLQIAYEQVRSKVYFPFTRFGENIVVAKKMENGVEKDREVHAFESVAEAQKFATMMKLKGWQVKQTVAREYSVDKEGPASKIVRQMHDIIKELGQGQQGLPGVLNLEDQLLDSLNQSFLQALPDMSYAKHFIHAKDVKGASRDALRSFAHSALHGAHHISRIRHADQVTKALLDLDTKINETVEGDTTEARQVYNELVKRHNDIMNPNTHPFSAWLGQLGFTMSLGGVVATGITNATQVPLVTYPWLGARYGFGKASATLARAYKDFLDPRTLNKDSLFDASKSKLISESERKMLLELARRGHIDLTQTMDLAGLSSRDNLSRKARTLGTAGEKVTRMLGFTFHVPEVMNRQVTALSTFRLEKEKGGSFDEALERAQQAIIDTHFLYQSFNRPRYMQGNFLRVLTMFRQYSQNIAYTYGRAASIWLDKNNATKEERTVAKRQLLSMLALQFGAAGALGMPFFGTPVDLLMAVVAAMGDDDEKRDWEVALRQWLDGQATSLAEAFIDDKERAEKVGKKLGAVVAHGASRFTPFDMASRLGQNDLFFREPQREREGRQAVMDWMMALGGPVPSYGVNFLLGMGDVAKGMSELNAGFFMRGVEELTPAVLRHGVRSLRYTLEGVRTRDEYKQLDLDTSEKLGQVFGFTPSRVAEMYESTTAVKNKEHRILNEQKDLKNRFARAVDDQDDNAKQRTLEAIRGFNERNPMFAITSNTLNRSLKARRQHEAGMERGMYLPPRRRALLEEGEFGDF